MVFGFYDMFADYTKTSVGRVWPGVRRSYKFTLILLQFVSYFSLIIIAICNFSGFIPGRLII